MRFTLRLFGGLFSRAGEDQQWLTLEAQDGAPEHSVEVMQSGAFIRSGPPVKDAAWREAVMTPPSGDGLKVFIYPGAVKSQSLE